VQLSQPFEVFQIVICDFGFFKVEILNLLQPIEGSKSMPVTFTL